MGRFHLFANKNLLLDVEIDDAKQDYALLFVMLGWFAKR